MEGGGRGAGSGCSVKVAEKKDGGGAGGGANNPPTVKKRNPTPGGSSGGSSSKRLARAPKSDVVIPPEPDDQPRPDDRIEEGTNEEAEEEEEQEAVEIAEEHPLDLLMQQGVSKEMSQKALDNANGDIDRAVMLIIRERELAAEEKLMAAAMEESLREAEEDAAKRDAEETEKKTANPLEFFKGSSFLANLGDDLPGLLLRKGSGSKDDLVSMLEFERQCKRWFRNVSREVERRFASIAAELVANLKTSEEGTGNEEDEDRGADTAYTGRGRGASGAGPGPGDKGGEGIELIHSMLVGHLMALKDAVLSFPKGAGGVPDVFSPNGDAVPEQIDLTDD